jgi:PKD repeat protein
MRFTLLRGALTVLVSSFAVSCSDTPLSPTNVPVTPPQASVVTVPQVVISQIYGGGGLAGAQYLNDFVELFNPGTTAVVVTGWSVQYASATSTNWAQTNLSGSIPPGGYYLVQLGSSLVGAPPLPTPDATGTTNINASNGKVALLSTTTRITSGTACPAGVVDFVAYGTAASGIVCSEITGTSLNATTAALRLDDGCTYTGSNSSDFTTGDPTPRNSATAAHACSSAPALLPPVAAIGGPYAGMEGTPSIALSGAASTAPSGTIVSYAWNFGDATSGSGANVTHTYGQDGNFTVTLIVTDDNGLADTTTATATVANVAPDVAAMSDAALFPGDAYNAGGSFADPGADSWSATVNYGDATGTNALPLSGKNFSLSHTFATAGSFTVTVTVSDDDVTTTRTHTVVVLSLLQTIDSAQALVDQLVADGKLKANPYRNNLETARKLVLMNKPKNAWAPLQNLLLELNDAVNSGKISAQDAEPLNALVTRIVDALS